MIVLGGLAIQQENSRRKFAQRTKLHCCRIAAAEPRLVFLAAALRIRSDLPSLSALPPHSK